MKKELTSILNVNKNKTVKINYEQLKNHLGYEDIFYLEYLRPLCDKLGLEIGFSGEFIVLTPTNKEEMVDYDNYEETCRG